MKCTGKYKDVSIDFRTSKLTLTVEVNEDVAEQFIDLKEKEKLDIEIKPHREKRSLDANAYFHVLVDSRQAEVIKGTHKKHAFGAVWTANGSV